MARTPSPEGDFFSLSQARWVLSVLGLLIAVVGKESLLGLILRQTRFEINTIVEDEEASGTQLPKTAYYENN